MENDEGNPNANGVPPDVSSVEEFEAYRRQRVGLPISERLERHLGTLHPHELEQLEGLVPANDELDRRVREEIETKQEGFRFHEEAGGLPFDWGGDSELQQLRPHDWQEAKGWTWTTRVVKTAPRWLRSVVRPRERRSRTVSRSSAKSGDSPGDPELPRRRGLRHVRAALEAELSRIAAALPAREAVGR